MNDKLTAAYEHLRAAATDCARAADDYDAEGLHGIADRFREHAANLWLIAGATDCPPAAREATPEERAAARIARTRRLIKYP